MSNYGIKIAKAGYDADTADNKNLSFNSALPCLKIVQVGKESAVSSTDISLSNSLSFPLVILTYLYDSVNSEYEPLNVGFDSSKLYLPGGEAAGSYYYYFICYS